MTELDQENTQNLMKPKAVPFFPAAYLIMTVTSLALLVAVSWLGANLIDYWVNGTSGVLADLSMLYWIAALVVVVPVHLWSYGVVRGTDRSQVTTFSLRVAHGLLGLYLLTTVGAAIALGAWLLATWLNAAFGTGMIDKQLWVTTAALVQAIIWSLYATVHFTRVRSDHSKPQYYVATVSVLSAAVVILSLVYPVPAYRDVAKDFVKETDLAQLQQAVGDYVDMHEKLPAQLGDLHDLNDDTVKRLGDYQLVSKGQTQLGIFAYELCATFAKSKDKGHDDGIGFSSHGTGKQCFTRTTVSGALLEKGLTNYVKNVENGVQKLRQSIAAFLAGAKKTVDQEVAGVERFAGGEVSQLESHLEGLGGGMTELQSEMERLEGNLTGLEGDTGSLSQDFNAVGKFFHDLLCGLGLCSPRQ